MQAFELPPRKRLRSKGRLVLTDLPDDVLGMIIRQLKIITAQIALQCTCKSFCDAVERVKVHQMAVSTSTLFGARLTPPHYSRDLQRFLNVANTSRLQYLRRLTLKVDSPSFSTGSTWRRVKIADRKIAALRHFSLEHTLSRQLRNRLPLSAPGLAKMVRCMPHLLTLSLSDVPNLGSGFFNAIGRIRGLRTLELTRCGMSTAFAFDFGEQGYLEGKFFPPDLTTLKLDVLNMDRAIFAASLSNRLLLTRMQNLAELELGMSFLALTKDIWFSISSITVIGKTLTTFRSCSPRLCALFEFGKEFMNDQDIRFKVVCCEHQL